MARTATSTGRRASPPPAAELTVYDEVWLAIEGFKPIPGPTDREDDQDFYARLIRAVAELPEEVQLSDAADEWFNVASQQLDDQQEIIAPPGFYGEEPEAEEEPVHEAGNGADLDTDDAEVETATRAPTAAQQASRDAGRERLADYRAKRKAAAAAAPAPAAPAAARAATPRRRAAPTPAPAPAPAPTGRRRSLAAPAPAPAPVARRRGRPPASAASAQPPAPAPAPRGRGRPPAAAAPVAVPVPAPKRGRGRPASRSQDDSISRFLRVYYIQHQDASREEIRQAAIDAGFVFKESTIGGILTNAKATIEAAKDLGYYKEPRPPRV